MEFKEFMSWGFLGLIGFFGTTMVYILKLILNAVLELKENFAGMHEAHKGLDRRVVSLEESRRFRPK